VLKVSLTVAKKNQIFSNKIKVGIQAISEEFANLCLCGDVRLLSRPGMWGQQDLCSTAPLSGHAASPEGAAVLDELYLAIYQSSQRPIMESIYGHSFERVRRWHVLARLGTGASATRPARTSLVNTAGARVWLQAVLMRDACETVLTNSCTPSSCFSLLAAAHGSSLAALRRRCFKATPTTRKLCGARTQLNPAASLGA
jgi:hypothetical protein